MAKKKELLTADILVSVPDPPEDLNSLALAYWNRIVPLLVQQRKLTSLDLEALEAICHQWGEYKYWQKQLADDPEMGIITYPTGAVQKSAAAALRDSAFSAWKAGAANFGLTPLADAKLEKSKPSIGGRGGKSSAPVDPIGTFAAGKYEDEE